MFLFVFFTSDVTHVPCARDRFSSDIFTYISMTYLLKPQFQIYASFALQLFKM